MTYLSTILADSPTNLWKFDESSGTVAHDSVDSNNGTLSSGVTPGSTGYLDGLTAFSYDGTNNALVLTNTILDDSTNNGGTFELWFNLSSVSSDIVLFSNGSDIGGSSFNGYGLYITGGHLNAIINGQIAFPTAPTIPTNEWHHTALTYFKSTGPGVPSKFIVYLDGQRLAEFSTLNLPFPSLNSAGIGRYPYASFLDPVNGSLQFAAWYNNPLSDSQILSHFAASPVGGTIEIGEIARQYVVLGSPVAEVGQIARQYMVDFQGTDPKVGQFVRQYLVDFQGTDPKVGQLARQFIVTYGIPVDPGKLPVNFPISGLGFDVTIPAYTRYTEHYDLQRAPVGDPTNYTTVLVDIAPSQVYNDTTADSGSEYFYRLRYYNYAYSFFSQPSRTPLSISPSVNVLDARNNPTMTHAGNITGFRYRGGRISKAFIGIIESFLSDVLGLKRRVLLTSIFGDKTGITNTQGPSTGIYGTGDQDPRYDPYVDGILHLQPVVSQINAIQLQYLRQQIAFKLSTLK